MSGPADTEWAWAAGFLDGEGWFGVLPTKRGHGTPIIEAAQARDRVAGLYRLHDLMGGCVSKSTNPGVWRWTLKGGARLREELPPLIEYLVVKRAEASLLYAYAMLVPPRGGLRALPEHRARQEDLVVQLGQVRRQAA
jgi:hypothetical protein